MFFQEKHLTLAFSIRVPTLCDSTARNVHYTVPLLNLDSAVSAIM